MNNLVKNKSHNTYNDVYSRQYAPMNGSNVQIIDIMKDVINTMHTIEHLTDTYCFTVLDLNDKNDEVNSMPNNVVIEEIHNDEDIKAIKYNKKEKKHNKSDYRCEIHNRDDPWITDVNDGVIHKILKDDILDSIILDSINKYT